MFKIVLILIMVTIGTQEKSSAIVRPHCDGVCRMHCHHGYVLDDRGCPRCICNPHPIPPCLKIRCAHHCDYGHKVDKHGCLTCECKPPPIPIIRTCPENSKSNIKCPTELQHRCKSDVDCTGKQKCCLIGCTRKCVGPKHSWPITPPLHENDKAKVV